ncbi:MAG TPA: DUF6176 family protein [Pseudonocardiaceae bacterium]|nr:DUF6176 family protein [Pseudonocardiaceae bacterium]
MIQTAIFRIRPEKLERLTAWLAELQDRRDEVRETFAQEGVTHEQAYVINAADGPLLVYVMEAPDHRRASEAFRNSTLPIDTEHKAVMAEVLSGPADATLHYDMSR